MGPFTDKKAARNKAGRLLRQWKRVLSDAPDGTVLLAVTVEPLWADLQVAELQS
ncbi:hypothetical protein [Streptomyces sp. NPDC056921]|uniref:hypothetical protein n=1 Tax=Streptomyces sp. NPDC056921 TaxID=3345966 RepID=UPI00362E98A5